MLGSIWSFKTTYSPVSVLGMLTADAWTHFETNPRIERISSYPTRLGYDTTYEDGFPKKRSHIPQLGVMYRPLRGENQGRIVYIDVMSTAFLSRTRFKERKLDILKREFRDQLNAGYGVMSELSIWVEPRMTNMRTIERHLKSLIPKEKSIVRDVMMRLGVATLSQVRAESRIPMSRYAYFDSEGNETWGTSLPDVDKAFEALMQLSAWGEVSFNMNAPIGDETVFTFDFDRGGYR
ncbi:hypothetical protein [Rhizobium tumorigenes]|uniref:Uncharacterized protein n=1 Tax=Rhizobium tumorigenes TaxID=2041385 RepID=A0AAF1K871_9HYPH|nr:hypothetical protein [Rhizobium tumorigenes]WFR97595.1 hypothetical protein PR017_20545 [Rhizobium tumorigenes]WFS03197.1 hypothetical protein PR016_21290 [Rhizobium tumorigenes]